MIERAKAKIKEYEKRYQLDLSYFIKNGFWVYLRQAISMITALVVSVIFARLATKEVFGQYNFILALLAVFSILSIPGLNIAVLQSVARGYDGSYKKAVKTSFIWSLLGIPALLGAGAYCYYYNTQIIGICLMMSSIFFPFFNAPNTWNSFLQGKKRFDIAAKYGSLQATINAIAMITILFANANHLILIFATYLVSSTLLTCLLFWKSLSYIENDVQDNECIGYGYFITTTNIVGTIANNIDKILIGSLLGAPELAVYAIGIAIPTRIKNFLKTGWSPFTPKFCQEENTMGQVLEKVKRFILPSILIVSSGALLYWLFIGDVILLLFGEKYIDTIIYSKVLLLMILISIPASFLGHFAQAKKNKKAIIGGYHVFPFVKLFIMCSFIYMWGIMGAVWALNLSTAVQVVLILAGMKSGEGDL